MEGDESTTIMCTILAIDYANLTYKACPVCERTQLDSSSSPSNLSSVCKFCDSKSLNPPSSSSSFKRLFRLLMSIATDTKVITVVCFDRVARVLFGCCADEFFDFAKLHPLSGPKVNEILEGEMFTMTLSKPKKGNARHLRVVSAIPLRTGFKPAIEALREYHRR
ncbi:hypothetical protein QN277_008184 [Acacia crassicarpa]|uniref:Replication factor A C-terminal domain-containing protein n=1 Tax=Acacia crassicarpa TaxID=499986 RepID=A0AAE1IQY7_9FABA|nr:hypothetical protein QN277_008184 [Acacia crassicarpa]